MATAIITLSDTSTGVQVSMEFGPDGAQEDSEAHVLAVRMAQAVAPEEMAQAVYGGVGHG